MDATQDHGKLIFARFALAARATDSDSAVFGQTFAIAVRAKDSDSAVFGSFGGLWRHMEVGGLIIFGWRAAVASKVTRPSELE